jgi:thiamine pyridinylase
MPILLRWLSKPVLSALVLAGAATVALVATPTPDADPTATPKQPLRISLFPYVPNPMLVKELIAKRWSQDHSDVPLVFVDLPDFDSYKHDPPENLDVFEFDAIGLEYYVRNNFVTPLSFDELKDSEDILDFAWKGSMVDGRLYAVPRLACTYVLIYRKDDTAITNAIGLPDLYKVLGDGPKELPKGQTEPVPEDGKGLLIDMSGGTDCACLYLDAFADVSGKYSVRPKLPTAIDLDTGGFNDLRLLARMAGKPQALFPEPYAAPPKPMPPPKRPAWFGAGKGRAFVGYSERLYFIPKQT